MLIPGELLAGLGLGISNPAIARVGLGVVPPERSGMASGISNTFRIGGLATGVAALGAIFQQRITKELTPAFGTHAAALGKVVSSAGVRAAVAATHGQAGTAALTRVAFVSGLRLILVIGMVVVAIGRGRRGGAHSSQGLRAPACWTEGAARRAGGALRRLSSEPAWFVGRRSRSEPGPQLFGGSSVPGRRPLGA